MWGEIKVRQSIIVLMILSASAWWLLLHKPYAEPWPTSAFVIVSIYTYALVFRAARGCNCCWTAERQWTRRYIYDILGCCTYVADLTPRWVYLYMFRLWPLFPKQSKRAAGGLIEVVHAPVKKSLASQCGEVGYHQAYDSLVLRASSFNWTPAFPIRRRGTVCSVLYCTLLTTVFRSNLLVFHKSLI